MVEEYKFLMEDPIWGYIRLFSVWYINDKMVKWFYCDNH